LEQRRRPTAKFQNDVALYHAVAMKLKHPHKAALIDECGEAQTRRLRCGKIVHRGFLALPTPESRVNLEFGESKKRRIAIRAIRNPGPYLYLCYVPNSRRDEIPDGRSLVN
jgi:hypothetical protein